MDGIAKSARGLPAPVERCLAGPPPRAGSFIVTVYGDVVEPRGGTLWMGTLIEVCAAHGISEGLVRTAVSRLVASGRLAGDRQGRKSYYRLTPEARAEFARAARVLFHPPPEAQGWLIRLGEEPAPEHVQAGWASAAGYAVAPNREDLPRPPGLTFATGAVSGEDTLPAFAARHWDVAATAAAYRQFLDTFAAAADAVATGGAPEGATSLALRLRLIHEYRRVVLADPRLPAAALPADWPGIPARKLFVRLYTALADSADRYVGQAFRDAEGPLPPETAATQARLEAMARERRPD